MKCFFTFFTPPNERKPLQFIILMCIQFGIEAKQSLKFADGSKMNCLKKKLRKKCNDVKARRVKKFHQIYMINN